MCLQTDMVVINTLHIRQIYQQHEINRIGLPTMKHRKYKFAVILNYAKVYIISVILLAIIDHG